MNSYSRYFCCFFTAFFIGIYTPVHSLAQKDPTLNLDPIKVHDETLSLVDAIRITLEHDPNIKLQQENTNYNKGDLQSESGDFDTHLMLKLEGSFLQKELSRSDREREFRRRQKLRDDINERGRNHRILVASDSYLQAQANNIAFQSPISDFLPVEGPELTTADGWTLQRLQREYDDRNGFYQDWAQLNPAATNEIETSRQDLIRIDREEINSTIPKNLKEKAEAERKLAKLGNSVPKTNQETKVLADLSAKKALRSGIELSTGVNVAEEGWDYRHKYQEESPTYSSEFWFDILVPLGKGRGIESSGAKELAARLNYESSVLTLGHTVSTSIFAAIKAYWELVRAQESLELYRRSAEAQKKLLKLSEAMVDVDELPRAELARIKAREANAMALLSNARKTLNQTRLSLARTIGLTVEGVENAPLASNLFPVPPESFNLGKLAPSVFVNNAITRRQDYKASLKIHEAANAFVRAARIDLKPKADFGLNVSYSGLDQDANIEYALDGVVLRDLTGPSFKGRFNLDWPFKNNKARGNLIKATATSRKNLIVASDLKRTIKSKVVNTLESLRDTVIQLEKNTDAAHYYELTWNAEIEKYKAGSSTLIDTIMTEEQLTEAFQNLVTVKAQYAQYLAQLRYETATLFSHEDEKHRVREDDMLTIPFMEGGHGN